MFAGPNVGVTPPLLTRFDRLHERINDTEMALGSDLMSNALEGYALLKVAGKGEGLDRMRRALSAWVEGGGGRGAWGGGGWGVAGWVGE